MPTVAHNKTESSASSSNLASTQYSKATENRLHTTERISGTTSFLPQNSRTPSEPNEGRGDISLNFVNADLRDFLRSVLGEMLGKNYIVDPSAQGTVTLETSRPIKLSAVLSVVESALQLNGLALVETKGLYRVLPISGAARKASIMSGTGLKTRIVPLNYVNANDMQQALDTIVPSGSILRADTVHNLLVVSGDDRDISNVLEAIATFDIDSLSGLSFGLFPVKNTSAKTLGGELSTILNGTTVANMVRLVPLDRLNALMVSSRQRQYIDEIEAWIARLDRAGDGAQQSLYVYRVQNGRAADLVGVLNEALLGRDLRKDSQGNTLSQTAGPVSEQTSRSLSTSLNDGSLDNAAETLASNEQTANGSILRVTADEANNAILVYATPEGYRTLESALQKLDVTPLQVLIEVAISEVTLTDDLRYGVQYYFTKGQHHFSQIENQLGVLSQSFPGFNYVWTSSPKIQATLSLLESVTKVKMLASPQLLVLNNQQAKIQVGDQVPIATQSATSTLTSTSQIVNSIQYKNTGIVLTVTPRVNAGGLVLLDISQEVSSVVRTTSSTLDSPTIQQRMITSAVAVKDEETIALGGLIQEHHNKTGSGIPLLRDIPYVGSVFGEDSLSSDRTELLVLITPHVIRSAEDGRNATEELRKKLPSLSIPLR